jgi:hypothetical protein
VAHPLDRVARGLTLARIGFRLAGPLGGLCLLANLVSNHSGISNLVLYYRWPRYTYIALLALLGLGSLAGWIGGFVGRCRCLATPEEWPVARTRIRLAVLLEACGWLSGLANVAVAFLIGFGVLPLPVITVGVTVGLSVLMLAFGRVMFLRFARAVADRIDDEPLAREAARSLVLFVTVVACWAGGFALLLASSTLAGSTSVATVSVATGFGLWIAAGGVGLAGLFVYDQLLGRLRTAVVESSESAAATGEEADK